MDKVFSDGRHMKTWTAQDIATLSEGYSHLPKEELCSILQNRAWTAIKTKARDLNLSRPNIRTHQLSVLLPDTVENAYWWGFIMADGFIGKDGALIVQLHEKDKSHLMKLAEKLGCDISCSSKNHAIRLARTDKINGVLLRDKLGITETKTTTPPVNLDFLQFPDANLAFLLGFIDGDGSITYKNGVFRSVRVMVHGSWVDRLVELTENISLTDDWFSARVSITSRGFALLYFGTKAKQEHILTFIETNNLPVMERKWYPNA